MTVAMLERVMPPAARRRACRLQFETNDDRRDRQRAERGRQLSSSALLGVIEFTTRALVADDGQIQLWCSRGKNGEQSEDIGLAYDGIDGEPRIAEVDVKIRIDLDAVFAGRTVDAEIISPNE